MKKLHGTVIYLERIMLPPSSEVKVYLEGTVKADAPSTVIAETVIKPQGGPPYGFTLDYDPIQLDTKGRYSLRARIENEGKLLFINNEHIPAFTGTDGEHREILVRKVKTAPGRVKLINTYWKLLRLSDEEVQVPKGRRDLFLQLMIKDTKVRGFSGCNAFSGSYELDGNSLLFGNLVSTMKGCLDSMDLEQRYLQTLEQVKQWKVIGVQLQLLGENGEALALFESSYMK